MTEVGPYNLTDRERHTADRRFRIDPAAAHLAVVIDTVYGRRMFHRADAARCIAWRNGYDEAMHLANRDWKRY